MIGLNDRLLHNYVEWIANRRMKAIGIDPIYDIPAKNNPLPWTEHWLILRDNKTHLKKRRLKVMSSEESNKMSKQTHSLDSLCEDAIFDAAEKGWDDLMDKADQPGNPFAEDLWEMEKKKARQQEERNTRHSVDKGKDFIESGMTLITDVESDRYLNKYKKVSE